MAGPVPAYSTRYPLRREATLDLFGNAPCHANSLAISWPPAAMVTPAVASWVARTPGHNSPAQTIGPTPGQQSYQGKAIPFFMPFFDYRVSHGDEKCTVVVNKRFGLWVGWIAAPV